MSALTPQILLRAYMAGIFPMAESADDPTLFWVEPEERGLIPLDAFHIPRSLRKAVRHRPFEVRVDTAFEDVITACAEETETRKSTWINDRILTLYSDLHHMGNCHSVETWLDGRLVGGLYGVRIGGAFFGESMFARATNASKVALVHLVARLNAGGFRLLDAQFMNDHLRQFGTVTMSKQNYLVLLGDALNIAADFRAFRGDGDAEEVLRLAMPGGSQLPQNASASQRPMRRT